jgi:RNA polymerase primary sigma factor
MTNPVTLAPAGVTMKPPPESLLADSIDRAREELAARGRHRGFVTSDDVLEVLADEDLTPEQIEEAIPAVRDSLDVEGIDVIDVPPPDTGGEDWGSDGLGASRIAAGPSAPTFDPIRMYLKELGRVPLLTAAQEVDLAMRIEAGTMAAELLSPVAQEELALPHHKAFRALVGAVVDIREHQLDPAENLRRQGIGLETVSRSYRPRSTQVKTGFIQRALADGEVARSHLIEANLRLVVSIAKRYVSRGMTLLDITQEGNLGLIHAVEKFDYRRGFKFSTYASWWIRQSVIRGIADQGRVIRRPVHIAEQLNRMYTTQRRLTQQLGREPVPDEVGRHMGVSGAKIREILTASREPLSLETPLGDEGDSHLEDFVEDPAARDAFDAVGTALLNDHLRTLLQTLRPREERVMMLRFGLLDGRSRTLEETSREFGLTRERIRQIESKALAKLRHPSRMHQLRGYLEE